MKKRKYMVFLVVILMLVWVCINGYTYARYASNSAWNYYLKSKGFYFSSEQLKNNTITDSAWDGSHVNFSVKNSTSENAISDVDINYEVTCSVEGAICKVNSSSSPLDNSDNPSSYTGILSSYYACFNNNEITSTNSKTDCEIAGNTWKKKTSISELYFELTDLEKDIVDFDVEISAKSISPYSKELKSTFTLHKVSNINDMVSLSYNKYDGYDRLVISNSYEEAKKIRLHFDANKVRIAIDKFTVAGTDAQGYINSIDIDINSRESKSLVFYSSNLDVGVNDFTIEEI